jgi:predicted phosphodiesterase
MFFALLGDVHASPLLAPALDFVASLGVDRVLCTGDLCDGPGDLAATLDQLRAHDVCCVRGNHDRWLLTDRLRTLPDAHVSASLSDGDRAWLSALPITLAFADGALLLTHSLFEDDMSFVRDDTPARDVQDNPAWRRSLASHPSARVVVTGHTHHRMAREIDGRALVNPGTLHPQHAPGFATLDLARGAFTVYEFRKNQAIYTLSPIFLSPASRG